VVAAVAKQQQSGHLWGKEETENNNQLGPFCSAVTSSAGHGKTAKL